MKVSFTVPGPVRPKERPRVRRDGRAYTPDRTRSYEAHVKACCMSAVYGPGWGWTLDGEYRVDIVVHAPSGVRADLDNCAKSLLDAMQGVAYRNDRQVVHLSILRTADGEPGADVTVECLSVPERRKR